jgi:uncharacterized protein YdhG (YjbR/CyaY superfamily)
MANMSKTVPVTTVEAYFDALPAGVRTTMEKVRKAIRSAAPGAAEVISYQIPTFKLNGAIAAFAAFKNHCSYFTMSHAIMTTFREELLPYHTSGVTIHFPLDKALPATLVKKLVLAKIKENELKPAAKKKKKVV